jgi:glycosyltransferase involved in cell wall biosynthesis
MTTIWDRADIDTGKLPATPEATHISELGSPAPFTPPANLRVSVIIPAKNEAESLPQVLSRLPAWVFEVILVDGLSEDDTSRVAKLELPAIRIVEQTGRGKGNALREGFVHCRGDVVVALDADGSMDPAEIGQYVDLIAMGHDYVKGSRMIAGGSSVDLTLWRRFGNWAFRTLTNVITGSRYSDLCYGYFAFRRGTVDALDLRTDGFEIETEINIRAHKAGLRIAEVPSAEACRTHGTSQLSSVRDGLRILFTIFKTSFGGAERAQPTADTLRIQAPVREIRARTPAVVPVAERAAADGKHSSLPE